MKSLYYVRLVIALGLFGLLSFLCFQIVVNSAQHQIRKYDEANINHMKYGMFNVSVWKDKLANIVVSEIEDFELNSSNKKDLKNHIENQLNTLIEKLDTQIKESNKDSTTGWFKQKLIDAFVDVQEIKKNIPTYAETITQEMTHPESQKKLKQVVKQKLNKYLNQTFNAQEQKEVVEIIKRQGFNDQKTTMEALAKLVPVENQALYGLTWMFLGVAVLLFALCALQRGPLPGPFFLLSLACLLVLLYVGVVCPMIDMMARITTFGFVLFGHKIEFTNQVVYFQSKSVLDVFWILISHKEFPMKVIGVLMIFFSIVLPIFKLLASVFYYYNVAGVRQNGFMKFLVLKSGKWSMTDALVVAIMMAYIGFNGMVHTQFDIIRAQIPQFDLISTNDTILQIGFFIFLCYVILSMLFAQMLERVAQQET